MQPPLLVRDLACARGERLLFKGLSFALDEGQTLQVIGANGTGKSSLLRIVAGLLRPFAGSVERRVAVSLTDDRLPLDEHLPLGRAFAVWHRLGAGEYAGDALASVGLGGLADVPVRFLSTGQRKRAALLLTIASDARLWLLDEPLNGLDTAGGELLLRAVEAFRARGGMAIVASHQPLALPDLRTLDLAEFAA